METGSADKRIWTWVSEDGKHAAAGMSLGPVATKPAEAAKNSPTTTMGGISGLRVKVGFLVAVRCAAR
jgi:hypothetical protein